MKAKNVTVEGLNKALNLCNEMHGYKLIWNRAPEKQGNFLHFTIRSEKSKIHGASVSWSGRNSCSASWEAHGHFFECVLDLFPEAEIRTAKATITATGGNWQDFEIGSMMYPMMASENAYIPG